MKVRSNAPSLRDRIADAAPERFFWDRAARLCVNHLARGTSFGGRLAELAGRSVVVATSSQLTSALALIELDGVARRLTILPPDTAADHLGALIACAEADAVVIDAGTPDHPALDLPVRVVCAPAIAQAEQLSLPQLPTEWVLLTSGTSGVPKMAVHSLASLIAPIGAGPSRRRRRLGHVLRHPPLRRPADIFARDRRRRVAGAVECRRADRRSSRPARPLRRDASVGHAVALAPRADVARRSEKSRRAMSGSPAKSPTRRFSTACAPRSRKPSIGHAYASTEAGVAFEVDDGLAGFPPISWIMIATASS